MWPVIGGLLSGGMGLISSMFSSDQSAKNVQAQIASSQQMQSSQNAWTEQMSNSAYQRSVRDMQLAGLNPMAMFSSGSGSPASSPQASTAQTPMPQTTSKLAGLGQAAEQVFKSALDAKTFDKMTDEIANLFASRKKMEAETNLTKQRELTEQNETERTRWNAAISKAGVSPAEWEAMNADEKRKLAREHPDAFRNLLGAEFVGQKTRPAVGTIAEGVSSAAGIKRLVPAKVVTKPSATLNREALEEYARRRYGGEQ